MRERGEFDRGLPGSDRRRRMDPNPGERVLFRATSLDAVRSSGGVKTGRTRPELPSDIEQARRIYIELLAHLRRTSVRMDGSRLREEDIIRGTGISISTIFDFKRGEDSNPNLEAIVRGLRGYVNPDDERLKELVAISHHPKWMATLTREGMTLQKAIQYLRISRGMTFLDFAEETGVSVSTLKAAEKGTLPFPDNLNQMMKGARVGLESRPAQYLRFQRAHLAAPSEELFQNVWSVEELQTRSLGQIMRYLRTLRGETELQVAIKLHYTESNNISDRELGKVSVTQQDVNNFIKQLDLEPDSTLAQILRQKRDTPSMPIPLETLEKVLEEKYLFAEHIEDVALPVLSERDSRILEQLSQIHASGAKVFYLRNALGFTKMMAYCRFLGKDARNIRDIEQNKRITEIYNLAWIINKLGYDIHHPITWDILDQLERERPPVKQKEKATSNQE
jgi:transcriptional regulator with XRE-family HTH domain